MLCWLPCSIPAWLCSLQGVGAAELAWGSRVFSYTFNCTHSVSNMGFLQLLSARQDLGFGLLWNVENVYVKRAMALWRASDSSNGRGQGT